MGAYLSEPVTEKISNDESNNKLECGASSMQGWRVNQEDAHNTILDFDENTALFAVYDGHGGAEVATYCSQKLPDFIKNTEAYKQGNMVKALEDAFLAFDATIPTKEIMDMLKDLAGQINPPEASDNEESDEDENVINLYQEAKLPLQEVLAKYEKKGPLNRARLSDTVPLSPCLRAKQNSDPGGSGDGASCSNTGLNLASGSQSELNAVAASSSKDSDPLASNSEGTKKNNGGGDAGVSSTNSVEDDKDVNGEVSTSSTKTAPDSSEDNRANSKQSETVPETEAVKPETCNGEVSDSKQTDGEDNNITSSNGATPAKKGKAKDKSSPVSSSESQDLPDRPLKANIRRAAAAVYKKLLMQASVDDDDESDSNDETFEGGEVNSSDEEQVNGVSDSDCEGEDEEVEEEECESTDEEYEEDISMVEEPGNDSGCTAVVALLKGKELYVANAGDSRCIVCREGKAVDMSVDHKPEDATELERIRRAGGKVSADGRVNGGLNLSRAIGDHAYKKKEDLGPTEQMITAQPDVKTITVDPATDQFLLLACDGIWNFMSSQDVCDFVLPKLAEGRERLSQICEEMFDHCLAPSTMGDGTGCDNMTAILVRFRDGMVADVGAASVATTVTTTDHKRRADDQAEDGDIRPDDAHQAKKQKIDDSLSSSIVTSSV